LISLGGRLQALNGLQALNDENQNNDKFRTFIGNLNRWFQAHNCMLKSLIKDTNHRDLKLTYGPNTPYGILEKFHACTALNNGVDLNICEAILNTDMAIWFTDKKPDDNLSHILHAADIGSYGSKGIDAIEGSINCCIEFVYEAGIHKFLESQQTTLLEDKPYYPWYTFLKETEVTGDTVKKKFIASQRGFIHFVLNSFYTEVDKKFNTTWKDTVDKVEFDSIVIDATQLTPLVEACQEVKKLF
jgi:hypothetical protein